MLSKEEESEVTLSWPDQCNINKFSALNQKHTMLSTKLTTTLTQKEYIDDLIGELELADDSEPIKLRIGNVFVDVDLDYTQSCLASQKEALDSHTEAIEKQLGSVNDAMSELKVKLYSKFGKSINLEK